MRRRNYKKRRKSKVEPLSPMGFRVKKKINKKRFILGFPLWVVLGIVTLIWRFIKLLIENWKVTILVFIFGLIIGSLAYQNIMLQKHMIEFEVLLDNYNNFNTVTTESIEELKNNYLIQDNQLKEKETKIEEQDKQIQELEKKNKQLSSRSTVTSRGGTTRTYTSASVATSGSKAELQAYAKSYMLLTYGWGDDQFQSLVNLWNRESGWNPNAHNKSSGAHGIPQALPASKMSSCGSDYYTNGQTQIRWGLQYIKGRYGTPNKAWSFFQSHNWY